MENKYTDRQIADAYKKDRELGAQMMLECYEKYIYSVLWSSYPTYMDVCGGEMFQCGVLGAIDALRTFNPDKSRFNTYCTPFIKHEAVEQICFISKEKSKYFLSLKKRVREAKNTIGENAKEVAASTGLSEKIVKREMSLETETTEISEQILPGAGPVINEDAVVNDMLRSLSKTQKEIVKKHVLEKESFRKIAESLGMRQNQVRKIYTLTIAQLRSEAMDDAA